MIIYVVAIERIIRISLADELREANYQVFEFDNADAALLKMNTTIPDLVISDLKMPNINGIELLKRIKKNNNNIQVILMTAYSSISTVVEAMNLGAYDYVEKPFENEKILIMIKHILELKQIKDENEQLKNKLNATDFRLHR